MIDIERAKWKLQKDTNLSERYYAEQDGRLPRLFIAGELVEETTEYYVFSVILNSEKVGLGAVLKIDGRSGPYPFPR